MCIGQRDGCSRGRVRGWTRGTIERRPDCSELNATPSNVGVKRVDEAFGSETLSHSSG
jgi:hypothetical protein